MKHILKILILLGVAVTLPICLIGCSRIGYTHTVETSRYLEEDYHIKNSTSQITETFNLSDYSDIISLYSYNKKVKSVNSVKDVILTAKEIWIENYSVIGEKMNNLFRELTIVTAYDKVNRCWLVYGVLPKEAIGVTPHVLIKDDGNVLAVWME